MESKTAGTVGCARCKGRLVWMDEALEHATEPPYPHEIDYVWAA